MSGPGLRLGLPSRLELTIRRIPDRALLTLGAFLTALLCALTIVVNANGSWPTVRGPASVFGNDPLIGFHDSGDSGITALGTTTAAGGVAIKNPRIGWLESWRRYGGGWWWVCAPRHVLPRRVKRCHLLRQTDAGPSAARVVDVTAVAARRAWGIHAWRFPTDSIWTARYRGKRKSGRHR